MTIKSVVVTKINAVREDLTNPHMNCYANDIATQVALSVTRVFANHQPTTPPKESENNMTVENFGNPNYVTGPAAPKRFVSGIIANDNPVALVKALNRLGLCSNEMADPLQKLAAAGRPLGEFFKVAMHDVDRALFGVEGDPRDRIGFKNSLLRAGLIK